MYKGKKISLAFARSWWILAAFLFITLSCRQSRQLVQDAMVSEQRGLLWMVTRAGIPDTSYLFGTIHMIPADDYFLPEGTREALGHADVVFFEVDLDILEDPAAQMSMIAKAMMPGELTLADLLSEEDHRIVENHFREMGLPPFMLERIKPIFLSVLADESLMDPAGIDARMKFYEMELLQLARESGKEVRGLEAVEYQLSIMDSIPYADQAAMLVESIRSQQDGNAEMDTLIRFYRDQEIESLITAFAEDDLSRYDSLLLINRNRNWIPVITEMAEQGSGFFAVGAAHLPGPEGVIALLRKSGFQVRSMYRPTGISGTP